MAVQTNPMLFVAPIVIAVSSSQIIEPEMCFHVVSVDVSFFF